MPDANPTPTPITQAAAPTNPVPASALTATPNLNPAIQFWLSKFGTWASTLLGGWLITKGWIGKDQAASMSDMLTGFVVLFGGNAVTSLWSIGFRKFLEFKQSPATPSTPTMTLDDVVKAIQTLAAANAAPSPEPAAPPAPPAAPAAPKIMLTAGAMQTIVDQLKSHMAEAVSDAISKANIASPTPPVPASPETEGMTL